MFLRTRFKSGFTLIELLIVVILFFILTGVAITAFTVGLRSWDSGLNRTDVRLESGRAMERMVRDISQASSITNAKDDTITFLVDLDDDGNDETVTFDVISNDLVRTVDGTDIPLATNVDALTFSYRDLNDDLMNPPGDTANQTKRDNIRIVLISIDMSRGDETFNLSSSVYVRNHPVSP